MIAKGTTHNNGVRLAAYMETSKDGERAELWQLRGFEATNIKDAFRDVHIMAGATKCEQPFFHVQVRNREAETLTRQQWELAADRIERMLGLTGQPRAITFHAYEHNGDEHMHVAWSRIDQDTLTAKPLPFFKERLKKISRELELHFGLEPVTNQREGKIKYAPTRVEDEQARRLGMDIHELRNKIRACFDRSDCGASFRAALEQQGLILAQGDRRNFLVIDQAGGMHALGKRILDKTAAQTRDRLSDLDRDQLPTVEMARALQSERKQEKLQDRNTHNWDRDRADRTWQDAVVNAAIEKEKVERQFVEPRAQETGAGAQRARTGSREREWPVAPPTPEPVRTAAEYHFTDAAREAGRDRNYTPPKELTGMSKRIMTYVQTLRDDPNQITTEVKTLSAVLDDKGIALARVTKDEADRSHREAEFAKATGRYATRFKEGEIVAVTEPTLEYRRNGEILGPAPRVHKLDQKAAAIFIGELDNASKVQGIDATKLALNLRAEQRSADWQAIRLENATRIRDNSRAFVNDNIKGALKVSKTAARIVGSSLDAIGNAVESLFAPPLTPEQIHQGEKAARRREAEAESVADFSKFTADIVHQRRQQENEQEAERRQHRERSGGGRER